MNSVITYMFEKIIVWHLSLWWKGIQEAKKEKEFNEQLRKLQSKEDEADWDDIAKGVNGQSADRDKESNDYREIEIISEDS